MNQPFESNEDLIDEHLRWTEALLSGDDETTRAGAILRARLQATRATGIDFPMLWLEDRLELTESELRVVWLLLAHELDPDIRKSLRVRCTENLSDVSFDVIRRTVYGPRARLRTWRELGPEGRLRAFQVIERTGGSAEAPEQRHTFKVGRRVLALAHGDSAIASEVAGIATAVMTAVPAEHLELDASAAERIRSAVARGSGVVIVSGRVGSGRKSCLSAAVGGPTLVVEARALSRDREEARAQLRVIAREARLLACVPIVNNIDALCAAGETADRCDLVESEIGGLVLATSTQLIRRRWSRTVVQIELPPLGSRACASLWQRALPQASETDADHLAAMYPLSPALIHAAGTAAQAACGGSRMFPEHIETGVRSVLDDRLGGLATRVNVTQSWDDLVLPEDQVAAMVELLARIRERRRVYEDWGFAEKLGRGLGVTALFSGPPGTGKTMAAGLIARDLGCELYQVDTSKISSKWIGETEKNLAALFDAAEAGHAMLLFDEADTLFGKRTDVKSSNDRHANQEVNYLLQRIESYRGICILTTNHESALDEAFRRRLSVQVRFPLPESDERRRLWQALIPVGAPTTRELGIDALADSFVMSGGYIRNAVLRAAFLAADEDSPISDVHLLRAARLEYEGMGKVMPSVMGSTMKRSLR